jgi:hypothetical protein
MGTKQFMEYTAQRGSNLFFIRGTTTSNVGHIWVIYSSKPTLRNGVSQPTTIARESDEAIKPE